MQKHLVFDENVLLYDAVDTSTVWTQAASPIYSSDVDLTALGITGLVEKHWGIAIAWPGVGSAGAATTQLIMYSAATASPTAAIATFPAQTLANTLALYQDADAFIIPIPMIHTLRYFRIGFTIGAADLDAGTITAGILPLTG